MNRLYLPEAPGTISPEVQPWVQRYPQAWAETAGMGLTKQRPPIIVELKASAPPVRVWQYPMSQEARQGITPHIQRLTDAGVLRKCWSPWNTPLLPIKKGRGAAGDVVAGREFLTGVQMHRVSKTCPRYLMRPWTKTSVSIGLNTLPLFYYNMLMTLCWRRLQRKSAKRQQVTFSKPWGLQVTGLNFS